MTFSVEVTVVDPEHVFEWNGRLLGIPGLFEGRHRFELEATPDATRLKHSEAFSGLAAPVIMRESVRAKTEEGFRALNEALKTRAEAQTTDT